MQALLPELLLELAAVWPSLPDEERAGVTVAEIRERGARAMAACRQQAKRRPFLRANVARQRALWARLDDDPATPKLAERAVELARTMRLPYDEAASLQLLSKLESAPEARRDDARRQARVIFERLGCRWHLSRLDEERPDAR